MCHALRYTDGVTVASCQFRVQLVGEACFTAGPGSALNLVPPGRRIAVHVRRSADISTAVLCSRLNLLAEVCIQKYTYRKNPEVEKLDGK